MALQFNSIHRKNPLTKTEKWYAIARLTGKRSTKDLSKDVADTSSLSAGDVLNVISNFTDQIPKWLMEGNSVKLDGLGTFRLSISSDGVATKDEVTANLIKEVRIIFEPDAQIKERIARTQINPVK
jgi:predicted histone-like DNA-binding protein